MFVLTLGVAFRGNPSADCSQRTAHGSFYSNGARPPPPHSLRSDDEFTRSPSSLASYPARHGPDYRNGCGPVLSWGTAPREVAKSGSSSPSLSSSLTSIVDRYSHSPLAFQGSRPTLYPSGQFYYDYTEEFESAHEQPPPPSSPLAPTPARSDNQHRPMAFEEDCDPC